MINRSWYMVADEGLHLSRVPRDVPFFHAMYYLTCRTAGSLFQYSASDSIAAVAGVLDMVAREGCVCPACSGTVPEPFRLRLVGSFDE